MTLKNLEKMQENLKLWLANYDNKLDPKTKYILFNCKTEKAMELAIKNAKYLLRGLREEEKYLQVLPPNNQFVT